MKSTSPRDPKKDIMLSPGNAALILVAIKDTAGKNALQNNLL